MFKIYIVHRLIENILVCHDNTNWMDWFVHESEHGPVPYEALTVEPNSFCFIYLRTYFTKGFMYIGLIHKQIYASSNKEPQKHECSQASQSILNSDKLTNNADAQFL